MKAWPKWPENIEKTNWKYIRFEKLAMNNNVTKGKKLNYTAKVPIKKDDFSFSLFLLLLLIIGLQGNATHTVRYTGSVSYFLRFLGCFFYTLCSFLFYFFFNITVFSPHWRFSRVFTFYSSLSWVCVLYVMIYK